MADKIEVIDALERCRSYGMCNDEGCPYYPSVGCLELLRKDALELLKEQQPKTGHWINPTSQDCHCSKCGEQPVHEPGESVPLYDFCPYCGAKMEWSTNT